MEEEIITQTAQTVRTLRPNDADFPYLLRELPLSPSEQVKELFIRGDLLSCDKDTPYRFLCVVGSRKHTSYGERACQSLIEGLRGYNICIVSGLAIGIDAIAHEAALSVGLPTIAFPGSGLDRKVLYPARNQHLGERIANTPQCALVSEFNNDFTATDWSFPRRNRLMAGISHATLVIEAKLDSGTLITSRLAGDYNRDIFAVPGPIFSPLSEGPNMLISKGAAIIRSSEDIIAALGLSPNDRSVTGLAGGGDTRGGHDASDSLSQQEINILDLLIEPMDKEYLIDKIIQEHHLSIAEINAHLSMLELSGYIIESGGMIEPGHT